jgi:hypothetical protein
MRRSIYRELATALLANCRDIIESFAASDHNRGVFAFALDCEPFHGLVDVCINTREGFSRACRKNHPHAAEHDLEGLHGVRYTPEQFPYREFVLSEETLQLLDEIAAVQHDAKTDRTAERHASLFAGTLVRVLIMLDPDFKKLDLTDDFLAYVHERGASEKTTIKHMRQTIPQDQFDQAFPEIKQFDQRLASLQGEPPDAQARFWSEALRDLMLERHSALTQRMQHIGITHRAASLALTELGSASVPPLLDLFTDVTCAPQRIRKGARAIHELDEGTREGLLTAEIISLLRTIQLVDEQGVARLQATATSLHHHKQRAGFAGPTMMAELANLLHTLRPHRFPAPQCDGDPQQVVNMSEFVAACGGRPEPCATGAQPEPDPRAP